VAHHLARPLRLHHRIGRHELDGAVDTLLERVQLPAGSRFRARFPHELSGGQRQRVAIARALAVSPRVLLADEPVSMLDVSVRIGILNLLGELRATTGMSILWVTHDIASARYLSDTIIVMYAGRVVEQGPASSVTTRPAHPYTRTLAAATPDLMPAAQADPVARAHNGAVRPDGSGCPFVSRCPEAMPVCDRRPPVIEVAIGHTSACWLHRQTPADPEASTRTGRP
jgi:peptide/nickel transport system ATP-binding protein